MCGMDREKLRGESMKKKNFVLLGESGSGKSEIAVNLACVLSKQSPDGKEVHFFDLDQTKPLFRSR